MYLPKSRVPFFLCLTDTHHLVIHDYPYGKSIVLEVLLPTDVCSVEV